MKNRLNGFFVALACVVCGVFTASAAVNLVVYNNTQNKPYYISETAPSAFDCLTNAVADAVENDVLAIQTVIKDGSGIVKVDKSLTLITSTLITSTTKSYARFEIVDNATLHFDNNGSSIGYFKVNGSGCLELNGGTFYSDGDNPIIETGNDSSGNVIVSKSALMGRYSTDTQSSMAEKAVLLCGSGTFTMKDGAKIAPYKHSSYVDSFVDGIVIKGGSVNIDNATIEADINGVFVDYTDGVGSEEISVSNTKILSGVCGVYAKAKNGIDVSLTSVEIQASLNGFKLESHDGNDKLSHLTLDGNMIVKTSDASGVYAIEDRSKGAAWDIDIVRGTYYRMKKSIVLEHCWIAEGSVASWNPPSGDDDLTLTVTCEKNVSVEVEFVCNVGEFGCGGVYTNKHEIPFGSSWSISSITPESFGVTNVNAVFDGWSDTREHAESWTGKVTSVSQSMTVYACWKPCTVTFWDPGKESNTNCTMGLSAYAHGGTVDIPVKPSVLGWEPHEGCSFVGWCGDAECTGDLVTSLSIPCNTNLYAKWVERSGGVAWIEGTTNTYKTLNAAFQAAASTSNAVVLIDNITDDEMATVTGYARLQMNGYSIGNANTAGERIFNVTGADACLTIDGEGGTCYGQLCIVDGGSLELNGGNYVCKSGSIVNAQGDNYRFVANNASFSGAADEESGALSFVGKGVSVISNSTVSCVIPEQTLFCGIREEGGELELAGSSMKIQSCWIGLLSSNATCRIVEGTQISATYGVYAYPSRITMSDSSITSIIRDSEGGDPYAFFFLDDAESECSLKLSGNNVVEGGVSDAAQAHPYVHGGLVSYAGKWADAIQITGGTYSHQASNDVVISWIPTNCVCTWETSTRFTVNDPNAVFKIAYDMTSNLPKGVDPTLVSTKDPLTYSANTNFTFKGASCANTNGYSCAFLGWYLKDVSNTNQVVAISNGCVVVSQGGKKVLTDITGDLNLVAKWGEWEETPCLVTFATGVVIKDPTMEDDDEFALYIEVDMADEELMATNGIALATDFPVDGLEFSATAKSITLPTGITYKGHTLKGWAVYDPDDLTDPENPPAWTNTFEAGVEISLDKFVDQDDNILDGAVLHAVWADGSAEDFNPTFTNLYNNERDRIMTGGDTYVGYIADSDSRVIGSITAKVGIPRKDGSVHVSAKVTINGEGSHSFSTDEGVYWGDTITADNMEKEYGGETHYLDLRFDSKTMTGTYDTHNTVNGGVNLFKGTENAKIAAEEKLSPFQGRWAFIFATADANENGDITQSLYKHKVDGELVEEVPEVDGQAFAWGYSYVVMEIKDKGKVRLTGKLANGKDVSATATAIIGDNMMCVPATCAVYSGKRGGGFGFVAYFRLVDDGSQAVQTTNEVDVASEDPMGDHEYQAAVDKSSVSLWDSTMCRDMPFEAAVFYTNYQRVADIELPEKLLFCVDKEKPGWMNATERLGYFDSDDWFPADPLLGFGYRQYVTVSGTALEGNYSMKAAGKSSGMKLVEGWLVPGRKGDNYADVKVKYDRKRGTFSGSFKVYSLKMDEKTFEEHLKKTKVSVFGAIAEGMGYGFGKINKAGSQPITLENPNANERDKAPDWTIENIDETNAEPPEQDDDDGEDGEEGELQE